MKSQVQTIAATGPAQPIHMRGGADSPINATLQVSITGTASYTVEFTCDGSTWLTHPDSLTAQTVSDVFTFAFPVARVRVNPSALTGTLLVTLLEV
jgi:hypothetical protein